MATPQQPAPEEIQRVIKRYSNRKLYDTTDSQYVTLQQIGEMVRRGEDVQIIDNKTKEDKTEVTLALIISEDLKNKPRSVPLGTLRTLIQERGERLLTTLRESPVGKLISGNEEGEEGESAQPDGADPTADQAPPPPAVDAEGAVDDGQEAVPSTAEEPSTSLAKAKLDELVETTRHTLDQLQSTLDDRVHKLLPGAGPVRDLGKALADLTRRVEAIEDKLDIPRASSEED